MGTCMNVIGASKGFFGGGGGEGVIISFTFTYLPYGCLLQCSYDATLVPVQSCNVISVLYVRAVLQDAITAIDVLHDDTV